MAKKGRKPNLPKETLERARREMYGQAAAPEEPQAPEEPKPQQAAPAQPQQFKPGVVRGANLRQEYAYVLSDLQHMGVLASILMAILIVLSFFL